MYKFINESNNSVIYVSKILGLNLILSDSVKQSSVTKLGIHIYFDSRHVSDNVIVLEKIYQSYSDALSVSERIQNIFETTRGIENNEVITFKY